jgi:hypothetical protein
MKDAVVVAKARVVKEERGEAKVLKVVVEVIEITTRDLMLLLVPRSNKRDVNGYYQTPGCHICGSFDHKKFDCDQKEDHPSKKSKWLGLSVCSSIRAV